MIRIKVMRINRLLEGHRRARAKARARLTKEQETRCSVQCSGGAEVSGLCVTMKFSTTSV